MIRHLLGFILALAMVGAASAGDRVPPMYNAGTAKVTLSAMFFAGGGSSSVTYVRITWTQTNVTPGSNITVSPSSDGRSCTVTNTGGTSGQVDVTCTFTNSDGTRASQTVTVCFNRGAVDHISMSASG